MAIEKVGMTLPAAIAAADLSAAQFLFVKITAALTINLAGAGDAVDGVLQNKPAAAGRAATVWGLGSLTKVVAGAAVTAGADVTPDAAGKAVTSTSDDYIAGKAFTTAANADEIISVWLTNPGRTA